MRFEEGEKATIASTRLFDLVVVDLSGHVTHYFRERVIWFVSRENETAFSPQDVAETRYESKQRHLVDGLGFIIHLFLLRF